MTLDILSGYLPELKISEAQLCSVKVSVLMCVRVIALQNYSVCL